MILTAVTPLAVEKIQQRMFADGRPYLRFRISIEGGGCSGLQYAYALCQSQTPDSPDGLAADDLILWQGEVIVVSDELSAQYLKEATLDYVQDLKSAKFIIQNPNTEMTCGCGSSFTLKEG